MRVLVGRSGSTPDLEWRSCSTPRCKPEFAMSAHSTPSRREVIADHWEFQAGDPVPAWLEQHNGLMELTFAVDVTVHADPDGALWVVPHEPTESPIMGIGYGEDVPVEIFARGCVHLLTRPPVDVAAYLELPR